jgi:pSer/pThr/pTyr-binding forkhead associated (FHA) protein
MKCTECNMENIAGALFCEECGVKLEATGDVMDAIIEPESEGTTLVLTSQDGSRLEIPAKDEIVVGREDPISDMFPDVDLTNLGGMDKGVSRKHAVIHRAGANYTVEDMGSTNGTFINKKKIQPHAPQAIKAGDELRFGKLALTLQAA